MPRSLYSERDYVFGQMMLTLRTAIGLTQSGLAEHLGISRRAVGEWEAGSSYPKAEHLKRVIMLGMKVHAFSAGHEAEEIHELWKAAHQKVLFDERWFSALLGQQPPSQPLRVPVLVEESRARNGVIARPVTGPRVDWGDALAMPTFYGREQELDLLTQWLMQERCRVVSVLGMGGIGKSSLAVNMMYQLAGHFEVVIFRSLRDAPSCDALLEDCLQVLSPQPLDVMPASLERRISLLLEHLRKTCALVVLDNLETLLEEGDIRGRFRPGYEGYGMLLRRLAETEQKSCLLLTSREKPAELRASEGKSSPVRSLRLTGLDVAACEQLFAEKEAFGTPQEQARLVEVYGGNPLALKIVAETITDLFGGEIDQFLTEDTMIFGSIADLLSEQFNRLSPLEQTVLCWLAITREPVTIEELLAVLAAPQPRVQLFEAIDSLRRRSLIERGQRQGSFTLQSVVLEYVTEVLITEVVSEIQQHRLDHLIAYGLEQARAREYVRQTQRRLLIEPILAQVCNTYQERGEVEEQLLLLVHQLREQAEDTQGYGPTNLIMLLRELRGHLRGLDLSHLSLRGAYLQGVEMQDASLAGDTLRDTVFTEALNPTWVVAISPTSLYWAAGCRQGDVRVWCEKGQRLHLAWQAHTDNLYTLAFSPDERTLVTGSFDGSLKLWDLQSGALLWTGWHTDLIRTVTFTPDGRTIASGGDDGCIRFWDVLSGRNVGVLQHPQPIFFLVWNPEGNLLASSILDGSIRLWQWQETQPATCIRVLTGHTNWVLSLAFAPDGTHLASASWDNTVKLWEVASGRVCQTLTGYTKQVYAVAWSPDGRTVASAGFDASIWLWDVAQSRYRAALRGHTAVVYKLAFTPDSANLLSSSEDSTIRVWDVASGRCVRVIEGYAVSFYNLAWSPDGRWLASAGSDLQVALWDVEGRTLLRVLRGHSWTVLGVSWSPDGRLLASCGRDNAIRLWDPDTGICLEVLRDPDAGDTLFYDVVWSPDGRLLASVSYLRGVQVWDMRTRTRCWVGRQHRTRIRRVAWSPDGTRLASCGDDGSICLWEASAGELLGRLQEHQGGVVSVAWSPDGKWLASGGGGRGGGELLIWDIASGKVVQEWRGLPGVIFAVVWSPDGERVISGNSYGTMHWWKMQSGECLMTREGHRGVVQALRVSSDGTRLASSGDDSAIQLWDVASGELLQTLRQDRPYERLNITGIRGLTEAQRDTLRILGAIEEKVPSLV
jgi:WD40 repeat protein/transcriptional regulator with XRE-family HTH domain